MGTFCIEPDCGQPSDSTRCEQHTRERAAQVRSRKYARENRFYNQQRWRRFSKSVRNRQPWCAYELSPGVYCSSSEDLVLDHATVEAYERQAKGLAFDVTQFRVLCRRHHGVVGSPGEHA